MFYSWFYIDYLRFQKENDISEKIGYSDYYENLLFPEDEEENVSCLQHEYTSCIVNSPFSSDNFACNSLGLEFIKIIRNPSEILQRMVVERTTEVISYLENPSESFS